MRLFFNSFGVWRSLVARIVRDDEVAGSNPVTPTLKGLVRSGFPLLARSLENVEVTTMPPLSIEPRPVEFT